MKRIKKTKTYGNGDNPSISVLKGRVTPKEFTRAFKAEGWDGYEHDIEYVFARKTKTQFRLSSIADLKAELYTIVRW